MLYLMKTEADLVQRHSAHLNLLAYSRHWSWRQPTRVLPILEYLLETFPFIDVNTQGLYRQFNTTKTRSVRVATPLIAVCGGKITDRNMHDTIRYLVGKGANVNEEMGTGKTPLLLLASAQARENVHLHTDIMRFLIENGADVNKADQYGNTILSGNYPKVALEAGADIHHRNAEGLAPLHVAVKAVKRDMVELLLDSGVPPLFSSAADPAHPDYVPCPLYLAAAYERDLIVDMFVSLKTCPPECVVDAYLLLGVSLYVGLFETHKCQKVTALLHYWRKALNYAHQNRVKLSNPSPRPEYDYQVEIKTIEELDAVWGTYEFMKKGLLIQCALILERCLGLNNMLLRRLSYDTRAEDD